MTDGAGQQEVVPDEKYISVSEERVRTVYDLQARRRIVLDAAIEESRADGLREFASGGVKLLARLAAWRAGPRC